MTHHFLHVICLLVTNIFYIINNLVEKKTGIHKQLQSSWTVFQLKHISQRPFLQPCHVVVVSYYSRVYFCRVSWGFCPYMHTFHFKECKNKLTFAPPLFYLPISWWYSIPFSFEMLDKILAKSAIRLVVCAGSVTHNNRNIIYYMSL